MIILGFEEYFSWNIRFMCPHDVVADLSIAATIDDFVEAA